MLHIHWYECVNYSAGEPAGPVAAISFEADMPAQGKDFSRVSAEFFAGLGSRAARPEPAGSGRVIRSWPRWRPNDKAVK